MVAFKCVSLSTSTHVTLRLYSFRVVNTLSTHPLLPPLMTSRQRGYLFREVSTSEQNRESKRRNNVARGKRRNRYDSRMVNYSLRNNPYIDICRNFTEKKLNYAFLSRNVFTLRRKIVFGERSMLFGCNRARLRLRPYCIHTPKVPPPDCV